jgi:polyphenol oxidase
MPTEYSLQISQSAGYADIPLASDGESSPPFHAFISLLRAGNMHFQRRNELPHRRRLFGELCIDETRVFSLIQKHTQDVYKVTDETAPEQFCDTIGDGLVTGAKDAILCVTVADCLPIIIIDKRINSFGIVHSGWKGTGIAMNAVRMMETEYGSKRSDIRVVIGPGIGPCCYNVDAERARYFTGLAGDECVQRKGGEYKLDLKQANVCLLLREGIGDIMVATDCTSCNPNLSSFRRDGKPDFIAMLAGVYHKG